MMRSLSSAVAGLRTHQTKMDVIGNNIANVNTYGFKASRTTFSDIFYQNLSNGNANSASGGGTNPTQIGYGSAVATIDVLNTQAGMTSTGRAMDVYITGDGFLVTQDVNGNQMYTRLGNLGFDEDGYLVDPNGNYVQGFPQRADGSAIVPADGIATNTQNIRVDKDMLDKLTGIMISAGGEIIGTLPGDAKISLGSAAPGFLDTESLKIASDSNLKGAVQMTVRGQFDATAESDIIDFFNDLGASVAPTPLPGITVNNIVYGEVLMNPSTSYTNTSHPNHVADPTITFDGAKFVLNYTSTDSAGKPQSYTSNGTIDSQGNIVFKDSNDKVILTLETQETQTDVRDIIDDLGTAGVTDTSSSLAMEAYYQLKGKDKGDNIVLHPTDGSFDKLPNAANGKITINFAGISFDLEFDPGAASDAIGLPYAFQGTAVNIGTEEGEKVNIGCLVLAKFRNAAGLMQVGNSNFMESPNSGEPTIVKPGAENTGTLVSNNLEMSNVDISKEFTDMITTQRGFQANTRIVTVSDEMLQELVNLKR